MSRCIKVNCSGSWANLIPCVIPERLESAMAACEVLAQASLSDISFRVIDNGQVVKSFQKQPRAGEPYGWHAANGFVSNPVQAGLDRTTSGAIGQP